MVFVFIAKYCLNHSVTIVPLVSDSSNSSGAEMKLWFYSIVTVVW